MMRTATVFLVSFSILGSSGKTFTRCDLYSELKRQGFPESQMRDWICLVEAESSGRTDVVGGPDDDGSYDHGLFQINDRYWCNADNAPGKGCGVACADLRKDDIAKAAQCTKHIYSQQGFEAWVGWVNECRGRLLPDISQCQHQLPDNYYYYREYFKYLPRFFEL